MTPEKLRLLLEIAGMVVSLTSLSGAALAGYLHFAGDNKSKVEPKSGDTMKTVATIVLVLVFLCSGTGVLTFGGLFFVPTSPDADKQTETAPDQSQPDQPLTPQPPAQDFSSYCNPAMPTGKTFTAPEGGTRLPNGTEITQGKAYMYRVINWSSDCKSAQVYLLFTLASPSYGISGPNYDGSPNHDQQTWLFEGDHLDNLMPKVMCALARETLSGGLGKDTNVVVHYSNQTDGRYVDVPEACMP